MKLNNHKPWIFLLIILIIVVNTFTVMHFIRYSSQTQTPGNNLFGIPDEIVIYDGDYSLTVDKNDAAYSEILKQNERRKISLPYFSEMNPIDVSQTGELYIEYKFQNKCDFLVPFQREERKVKTDGIQFILTGEHNAKAFTNTRKGILIIGRLNTDAELIETAKRLLSAEILNQKNFKFDRPDEMRICKKDKMVKLTNKDEQFQTIFYLLIKKAGHFAIAPLAMREDPRTEADKEWEGIEKIKENDLYVELIYHTLTALSFPVRDNEPLVDRQVNKVMIPLTEKENVAFYCGQEKYERMFAGLNTDEEFIQFVKQILEESVQDDGS